VLLSFLTKPSQHLHFEMSSVVLHPFMTWKLGFGGPAQAAAEADSASPSPSDMTEKFDEGKVKVCLCCFYNLFQNQVPSQKPSHERD